MKIDDVRNHLTAAGLVLLSTFLTIESPAAAVQNTEVCSSKANENPLVKGRSKSVTFPDGRTITVVGHLHGTRQIYQISDLVESGQLSKMSDEEFHQLLVKIADENRTPYQGLVTHQDKARFVETFRAKYGVDISGLVRPERGFDLPAMTVENHAVEDFTYLSQVLAQPGNRISFVGYEGPQETWSQNLPYYLRARGELLRQFHIRKGRGKVTFTQEQMERLILSASNGNVYAYMRNPDLDTKVPMFGSESPQAGAESQQIDPLRQMNDALRALIKADDAYWNSKSEQEKQAFQAVPSNLVYVALLLHVYSEVQNMNVSSYAELDAMIGELRAKAPSWVESSLEALFRSFKERVRINFARDASSARSLAGRYETGLHFVGLNHFNSTVSNLETLCRQELNRSYNTATHPTSSVR